VKYFIPDKNISLNIKMPYASKMPKSKPVAPLKEDPLKVEVDTPIQFNLPKVVADDKKVKPKQVFENYTEPKPTAKKTSKKKKKEAKK
tara:strand:+ start:627 stop:890 length:264 start_codon:yes stop_codon:yes gene_type:complete